MALAVTHERRLTIGLLVVSALLASAIVYISILRQRLDAIAPRPSDGPIVERAIQAIARSSGTPVAEWRDTDVVIMNLGRDECVEFRGRGRYSRAGAICFGTDQRVMRIVERGPPFP